MQRMALAAIAAACVLASASQALAGLDSGKQRFLHGDYASARSEFESVPGARRREARLALARVDLRTGQYDAAERRARSLAGSGSGGVATRARVFLAEIYRLTGRLDQARRELEPIVANQPDQLRARYLLGRTYRDLGETKRAEGVFDTFFDDWNAGKIDHDDAEKLMYVALAARYLSSFQDANDTFREAVNLDPELLEANLEWGYLFLDKYAAGHAEQSFDEVLKTNPRHPDAHAGMAQVKLDQNYDVSAALHHLEQALEVNPRHVPSLLVRAGMEIDKNQWDAATATLDEVFAVNADSFRGRALLATIHWLRDETDAYDAIRRRVFADNPSFAEFFHIVARSAVREHRYQQAIELEKQAVKIDPTYYEAMQSIGTGYLRLGREQKGLEWLRKAWEGDEYNVRTYNTLELFEETIPNQYSFARSEHFKLRYHNDEKAILRRYVEPLLERAYDDMVRRYGYTPKKPITIELFRNPDHYSVRTIGLPNLGALGVCFGRVITAMSPTNGNINWAMVLWHELSHVFAIQMSDSRVPRWYTEGLSEYETIRARPEWRRENDADVWAALAGGTLPSVADLNHGFMRPNMEEVVVSYHLSSIVMEYIATRYGFERIVEGLRLFGAGKETPEVIATITGKSVTAFDKEFRGYLRERLAPYDGSLRLPKAGMDDVDALAREADASPEDAGARARLALGHFYDGNARAARAAAERALAIGGDRPIAHYVMAELALRERDLDGAERHYRALLDGGHDGFDVRGRLGWIAAQRGNTAEAKKHLCAAKKLDPERSYPYQVLSDLYREDGNEAAALRELEGFVMLEQMQYAPAKRLVDAYAEREQWPKVRTYGELARNINPADGALLLALGRAYLETGSPKKAQYSYASALALTPQIRRPALAHVGRARALVAQDLRDAALEAVQKALELEPDNGDARALRSELEKP